MRNFIHLGTAFETILYHRKQFWSLNCQMIGDADRMIRGLETIWPGLYLGLWMGYLIHGFVEPKLTILSGVNFWSCENRAF